MKCTACGKKAGCIDSREREHSRWRRYSCECGFRFNTLEMVENIDNLDDISDLAKNARMDKTRRKWIEVGKTLAKKEIRDLLNIGDN